MRVFLDANVPFTAAYNDRGLCSALFRFAADGQCELVTSAFAAEEARRNVALKAGQRRERLEDLLQAVTLVPEPPAAIVESLSRSTIEPKDAPIPAAAMTAECRLLVTGDRRHFGHLHGREVAGVRVATPSQVFDLLAPR